MMSMEKSAWQINLFCKIHEYVNIYIERVADYHNFKKGVFPFPSKRQATERMKSTKTAMSMLVRLRVSRDKQTFWRLGLRE